MSSLDFTTPRDQQRTPVWWGLSSTDGVSLVPISIGANGRVAMDIGTSVSAVISNRPSTIPRDGNRIPAIAGIFSDGSGTICPISVNPATGAILAKST